MGTDDAAPLRTMSSPIESVVKNLLKDQAAEHEPNFYDDLMGFYYAVNWNETWLRAVGCFHLMMAVAAIIFRNNLSVQSCIFLTLIAIVAASEQLNTLGGRHWKLFATQVQLSIQPGTELRRVVSGLF